MAEINFLGAAEDGTLNTGTSTIALAGTSPAVLYAEQLFSEVDGIANGDTGTILIRQAAGTWALYEGATYNSAGPTITFGSATLKDAKGTLTSAACVVLGLGKRFDYSANHIQGLTYSYVDADTITIAAGSAMVNGTLLTLASAQNEDVTITGSAIDAWYIYAYNNSGIDFEFSTTEPVFETTYGTWVKTGDATRRCIGKIFSNASNNIQPFAVAANKYEINIINTNSTGFAYCVNAGAATSFTEFSTTGRGTGAVALNNLAGPNTRAWGTNARVRSASANGTGMNQLSLSLDGTNTAWLIKGYADSNSNSLAFGATSYFPHNPGITWYYKTGAGAGMDAPDSFVDYASEVMAR